MSRYRVRVEIELMATGQDEAAGFVEDTYGGVDPEPERAISMSVIDVQEIEIPLWVQERMQRQ